MIVRIFRSWGALAARLFLFGEFGLELGDFGLERRDFGIPGLAAAGAWNKGPCRLLEPDSPELAKIGDAREVINMQKVYRLGEEVWSGPGPYR